MSEQESRLQLVRKCVNFIYAQGSNKLEPIGTGFYFGVPLERGNASSRIELFMVTSKHVLYPDGAQHYPAVALRVKRKDGLPPKYERIRLGEKNHEIFVHPDSNVDLVMFHCYLNPRTYDFDFLPDDTIPTEEIIRSRHIAEGTPICISGMFSPYVGDDADEPFLRYGKVSLMPKGQIPVHRVGSQKVMINAYLCETLSFSGNSGSPVFFALDNLDGNLKFRYDSPDMYLAGVIRGHYPDLRGKAFEKASDEVTYQLNAGIAVVTPSYQLRQIVESERVTALLDDSREKVRRALSSGVNPHDHAP
jgi:hypothetical protein